MVRPLMVEAHPPAEAAPEPVELDDRTLQGLAASAKRVFHCIREHGPIAHGQLHDITRIPPRTIRFAIRQLRERDLVQARLSLRDCRTCLFFIHPRFMSKQEAEETGRQLTPDRAEHVVSR